MNESIGKKLARNFNFINSRFFDIKRNWVDQKGTDNMTSYNLLVIYEIADKASRVKTKKAYREFEKWAKGLMTTYHDAAVEKVANMHLFRLRDQFSF